MGRSREICDWNSCGLAMDADSCFRKASRFAAVLLLIVFFLCKKTIIYTLDPITDRIKFGSTIPVFVRTLQIIFRILQIVIHSDEVDTKVYYELKRACADFCRL